jgi:hypothetical protein
MEREIDELAARTQETRRGSAMDSDLELASVHATTPYSHRDANRGHSGIAGMKMTSSRCLARSGKKISAAAVMHGRRRDLAGAHGLSPRGHGSIQNLYEMEEGNMGFSPKTENKDRDELEMAGDRKGRQRGEVSDGELGLRGTVDLVRGNEASRWKRMRAEGCDGLYR